MKIKYATIMVLAILLLLTGPATSSGKAQSSPAEAGLEVRQEDQQGLILELTVTDFQVDVVELNGQTYQTVSVPDAVPQNEPGEPQVPVRGTLIGIPSTKNVRVEILETDYETRAGYRLLPAPTFQVKAENLDALSAEAVSTTFTYQSARTTSNTFYPDRPAEVGYTGYMRDQAVAQIQFYPVQTNLSSGEARLYHRILVRVTWDLTVADTNLDSAVTASAAYETVLQESLLNYETLARPPLSAQSTAPGQATERISALSAVTDTLKIGVTEDGVYRLEPGDLTGAGFDLSGVALSTIKIKNRGAEIPLYVHDDNGNDAFDSNDYLLFYGTAVDDIYTEENVYWLEAGGGAGQRTSSRSGDPNSGFPLADHFPTTLHAEEDSFYWQTIPDGEGQDHWFWGDRLKGPPASQDYAVTLNNLASGISSATMRVRLKGYTDLSLDPDHHTRIRLNGNLVDDKQWNGQVVYDHMATFSHSLLQEGANTIRVEIVDDIGAAVDQVFVNWIEIDYRDRYVAEGDRLLFQAPAAGQYQFQVTGFNSNDVQLFDITDPDSPILITNTDVTGAPGAYTLQFEDMAGADTRYLALASTQQQSPAGIELDEPSSWKSIGNAADYIIITHEDFYTAVQPLVSHHQASGLDVVTVKVQDIYDEFNHGIFNPQAIRDFLDYAYHNWAGPAPTYVLLVGEAYQDYKDNMGYGVSNYVPAQIIETSLLGETPSDNWYVLVNGDDILPDMLIGRLSADSSAQVTDIVDKIIDYDQNPPTAPWNTNVLLVADDDELSFKNTSEQLAARLPFYYTADRVYVDAYPPGDPTADIIAAIDDGRILVNYTGHGDVDMWGLWNDGSGNQRLFERSDVDALNNLNKLPLVTVANCLNGFFTSSRAPVSLAEAFQRREDRGAVAVWAPTGLGYPSGHRLLMEQFYEAIFQDDAVVLGAATTAAKLEAYAQNAFWSELVETYVLFGDPATELGIPANYPYVESTTPADTADNVPPDQEIQIAFSKPVVTSTISLASNTGLTFTPTWNSEGTVVTYDHAGFTHGQTVMLSVTGQDRLGNAVQSGPTAPQEWSFTVTNDTVAPSGSISIEGGTLTDVPLNAKVIVNFTEPMRTDSVTYTIDPAIVGWLTWDANEQVATFNHSVDYAPETQYTFTVTAAEDKAGNQLAQPLSLTFETQALHLQYLPLVRKE